MNLTVLNLGQDWSGVGNIKIESKLIFFKRYQLVSLEKQNLS